MSVRDEVVKLLQAGPRMDVPEKPVDDHLNAWALNLSRAYQELSDVAVRLAEHVDRLDADVARLDRLSRGETIRTRGAST